jgi:plasmid stabilization system protein ParE
MKLVWSYQAARDLDGIYEYYAAKNIRAAARIYNSVIDATEF